MVTKAGSRPWTGAVNPVFGCRRSGTTSRRRRHPSPPMLAACPSPIHYSSTSCLHVPDSVIVARGGQNHARAHSGAPPALVGRSNTLPNSWIARKTFYSRFGRVQVWQHTRALLASFSNFASMIGKGKRGVELSLQCRRGTPATPLVSCCRRCCCMPAMTSPACEFSQKEQIWCQLQAFSHLEAAQDTASHAPSQQQGPCVLHCCHSPLPPPGRVQAPRAEVCSHAKASSKHHSSASHTHCGVSGLLKHLFLLRQAMHHLTPP